MSVKIRKKNEKKESAAQELGKFDFDKTIGSIE